MIRRRAAVVVMAALLALYLAFTISYAVIVLRTGEPAGIGIGVALLVLPLLGAWALAAELVFGVRSERLARRLEAEGRMPFADAALRPSGRVERSEADAEFPEFAAEVERAPGEWQGWFRLALAYDAAGDRRRARWATRRAIALSRGRPAR